MAEKRLTGKIVDFLHDTGSLAQSRCKPQCGNVRTVRRRGLDDDRDQIAVIGKRVLVFDIPLPEG